MLFAIIADDKSDSLEVRMSNRPAHLDFLNSLGDRLKLAGPFLDASDKPTGSFVVVEADDIEAARRIAADDPYAKAGLFEAVMVRPWKWTVKNPDAA